MKKALWMLGVAVFLCAPAHAQNLNRELLDAAGLGNTAEVNRLLRAGGDVNAKDNDGQTALMFAAYSGRTDTVRFLLEEGADTNAKLGTGETAMGMAQARNLPDVVALPKSYAQRKVLDSGSFGIFINGKRARTEKFSIVQEGGEGILTAQAVGGDGAEWRSELRVGSGSGDLKTYHATFPDKEECLVEPKDDFLIQHVTTAKQEKRDVLYRLPVTTQILDQSFLSHYELLIWYYLHTGCNRGSDGSLSCAQAHFDIVLPRRHAAGEAIVELLGREKINLKGTQIELNKVKVDIDGEPWHIWVDDHYKVIKMASDIEVVRD